MNDQAHPFIPNCLQAALDLASLGWDIFPLKFDPEGKKKSFASAEFSGARRWGATSAPADVRGLSWREAGGWRVSGARRRAPRGRHRRPGRTAPDVQSLA